MMKMKMAKIIRIAENEGWSITSNNNCVMLSNRTGSISIAANDARHLLASLREAAENYAYTAKGDALSELYFNVIEA